MANLNVKTPTTARRTPITRFVARPLSTRRAGPPTTPHAIRALQQRRNAGLTPGRDHRRSGRFQRETPRDDLRKLASLLSKKAPPRLSEKQEIVIPRRPRRSAAFDDDDDMDDEAPPRLSMPLDDDMDSWHEAPPRLSVALDADDDLTMKSFEAGRRALLDDPRRRSSYGFAGDLGMANEASDEDDDDDAIGGAEFEEEDVDLDEFIDEGGETGELRALVEDAENRRASQPSAIYEQQASPGADGEPTFVFRIPERRRETLNAPDERASVASENGGESDGSHGDDMAEAGQDGFDEEMYAELPPVPELGGDSIHQELHTAAVSKPAKAAKSARKPSSREKLLSRHGLEYPSFPSAVVKRVASGFAKRFTGSVKLNKDSILAMQKASDWFFEQMADDLGTYASHAGRKTIDEADVIALMRRYYNSSWNLARLKVHHR